MWIGDNWAEHSSLKTGHYRTREPLLVGLWCTNMETHAQMETCSVWSWETRSEVTPDIISKDFSICGGAAHMPSVVSGARVHSLGPRILKAQRLLWELILQDVAILKCRPSWIWGRNTTNYLAARLTLTKLTLRLTSPNTTSRRFRCFWGLFGFPCRPCLHLVKWTGSSWVLWVITKIKTGPAVKQPTVKFHWQTK